MKRVAKVLNTYDRWICPDEMLAICDHCADHQPNEPRGEQFLRFCPLTLLIVLRGGHLFRTFVVLAHPAPLASSLLIVDDVTADLSDRVLEASNIHKKMTPLFYSWVMTLIVMSGIRITKQRFFVAFILRFSGLSKRGLDILGSISYTLKHTSFSDQYKKMLAAQQRRVL